MPRDIAKHLIREYGTASLRILEIGLTRDKMGRLHPDYPFVESEVLSPKASPPMPRHALPTSAQVSRCTNSKPTFI